MNEKKIQYVIDETAPPPFQNAKQEMQFCYHCGGWCVIDMIPCPVCFGRGSVKVKLPLVEELALAE